jgi:hypothetical protein
VSAAPSRHVSGGARSAPAELAPETSARSAPVFVTPRQPSPYSEAIDPGILRDRRAEADAKAYESRAPSKPIATMVNGLSVYGVRPACSPARRATPTAADPLAGLAHLPAVALVGRDRILVRAAEPVAYAWKDIAVLATIILLAGGPSGGKTTLLFLILVARANVDAPISVLGRTVYPAPLGRWIVLIEGEHGEGSAARKLVRTCALLGVSDAALERIIIVARKAVRIGSPEWADVLRMIAAGIVSDIALDTVARCAPADANDEREQVAIFEQIAAAIDTAPTETTKPIVWAVGHTRKGPGDSLDDVSGSIQRTGQADSVLLVKGEKQGGRTVSSTVTFAKLREEPDEYPEPVTFAIVAGPDGKRELRTSGAEEADGQPLEARILAALALGPKTKTKLCEATGRSKADVDAALTNLFAARAIVSATVKVRGVDRKAFDLATPSSRWASRTDMGRTWDEHPRAATWDGHGTDVPGDA